MLLLSGVLDLAPSTLENYGNIRCNVCKGKGKPTAWVLSSRWAQHGRPRAIDGMQGQHPSGDFC